ncbi:hypothetical protein OBBRIDRAFT_245877 [Obba rivulosa]|uniref:Uncharacterized protein n=1 Tax=Obba rivulosa TaxID=1052685 RepID=A0A8E2AKM1_9APHY|nr:hypothetical protein OBBRIDRAFT_245877 [Obba rivulosa]
MPNFFSLSQKRKRADQRSPERMSGAGSTSAPRRRSIRRAMSPEPIIGASPDGGKDRIGLSSRGTLALVPEASPRKTGWLVLKKALETVRDGCDLFLPLKAALVGVVAVMEIVDVCYSSSLSHLRSLNICEVERRRRTRRLLGDSPQNRWAPDYFRSL